MAHSLKFNKRVVFILSQYSAHLTKLKKYLISGKLKLEHPKYSFKSIPKLLSIQFPRNVSAICYRAIKSSPPTNPPNGNGQNSSHRKKLWKSDVRKIKTNIRAIYEVNPLKFIVIVIEWSIFSIKCSNYSLSLCH